ncbi:MAG: alpha/beta fold hydrolase [Betaproteobacteria bacterium]|nr:alpha/beta fold hydrolase [Betaproteobacteria bacterium]
MKQIELPGGEHAVLLIHGLQGVPTEVQSLAKRLHKAGYAVRVPHFKGYGYTAGDNAHSVTPWQDWRNQVLLELRDLKRQYKTVSIGGLCIGAVLALSVAEEAGGEISGLSLLATTLFYDGWSIPWYRFMLPLGYYTPFRYLYAYKEREPFGLKNEQLRRWVAREMSHKASSIAGASNLTLPAIHEAELLIKSVKRNLPRVTTPALVIHAVEDDVSTPRSADFVVNHIGSDKVQKILLHDSYHIITMDNERERVADETIKFFNDCTGRNMPGASDDRPVVLSAPRLTLVHTA